MQLQKDLRRGILGVLLLPKEAPANPQYVAIVSDI